MRCFIACYIDVNASSGSERKPDDQLPQLIGGCSTLVTAYIDLTAKGMLYRDFNRDHDHRQESKALWSDSDRAHSGK